MLKDPMKVRKFYPISAIRKLAHKSPAALSAGERAAFAFAARKSRKLGIQIVASAVDPRNAGQMAKISMEQAAAILSNADIKIFLKVA